MQIEIGSVLEGKITSITSFGAFVSLGEGKSGMIHISEVSSSYVRDIHDFLKEGQTVGVKVITIDANGRIGLSIKKLEAPEPVRAQAQSGGERGGFRHNDYHPRPSAPAKVDPASPPPQVTFGQSKKASTGDAFEDMMSRFKVSSDEKISDLKKNTDSKRSSPGYSRRGSGK